MPLDANVLKNWAAGQKAPPALAQPGPNDAPEEGAAEKNALWAGELAPEAITPEIAQEFVAWLEDNEPEIFAAVSALAEAVMNNDQGEIDDAIQGLSSATQYLNPEYPPLDDAQKKVAAEQIPKHLADKGNPPQNSPEHAQAIAIGMSEARKGKDEAIADPAAPAPEAKKPVPPVIPKAPPFGGAKKAPPFGKKV